MKFFFKVTKTFVFSLFVMNVLNATSGNYLTLIGSDTSGNKFSIWNASSGSSQVVSVGQYSGVSWSNQALSNPADFSFENAIGVIPSGEAVAFWISADFVNGCNTLYAATYSSGVWSSAVAITPITESVYTRSLQFTIDDTTQNVTATWQSIVLATYVSEIKSSDSNLATNVWTAPITVATL